MDTPIILVFCIKSPSNSIVIRSVILKEYFSKLTSNVEVLYPTQFHSGLLLCKSKRSKFRKILFFFFERKIFYISGRKDFKYASYTSQWINNSFVSLTSSIISTNKIYNWWTNYAIKWNKYIFPTMFTISSCFGLRIFFLLY